MKTLAKHELVLINSGGIGWEFLGRVIGRLVNIFEYAGEVHVDDMQSINPYSGH